MPTHQFRFLMRGSNETSAFRVKKRDILRCAPEKYFQRRASQGLQIEDERNISTIHRSQNGWARLRRISGPYNSMVSSTMKNVHSPRRNCSKVEPDFLE